MTPTLYLSNWSSYRTAGAHGHGRKWTIMASPRAWEHGRGRVEVLTPLGTLLPMMQAAIEDRAREGWNPDESVPLRDYRAAFERHLEWSLDQLAPWKLNALSIACPDFPADEWIPVRSGETLCCACSVAEARAGRCHRAWVAPFLTRAGWNVVLDGVPRCRAVAGVLRSWSGEHPKELWDRLAASPPPAELVERAATVLWLQGRTASNCPLIFDSERWKMGDLPRKVPGDAVQRGTWRGMTGKGERNENFGGGLKSPVTVARRCEEIASSTAAWLAKSAGSYGGDADHGGARGDHKNRPNPANRFCPQIPSIAEGCDAIAEGTAAWLALSEGAAFNKPVTGSGKGWEHPGYVGFRPDLGIRQPNVETLARDVDKIAVRGPLAVVHGDLEHALSLLPEDLTDCVVYLDPPYVGCTSYAAACSRERVLALARELDRRGAIVVISEAVPLDALGWNTLEITRHHGAHWQKRKVKTEWLTLNRRPVAQPGALGLPL